MQPGQKQQQRFSLDVELAHESFALPSTELPFDNIENFSNNIRIFPQSRTNLSSPKAKIPSKTKKQQVDDDITKRVEELTHGEIRAIALEQEKQKKILAIDSKHVKFSDIVDLDDEAFEDVVSGDLARKLSDSSGLKLFMTAVIIINSVFIALETNTNYMIAFGSVFDLLDNIFITCFVVEILLKWYCGFTKFWRSGWNIFDFLLIFSAIVAPTITFISSGRVLRVLRILRAFRALRGLDALEGLRMVANTVIDSIPDMLNILLLMLLLMFIFSVVGVTLFASASPYWFGDLPSAMFALFVMMTTDGFEDTFNDIIETPGMYTTAAIYFVTFITLGAFVLLDTLVAVVVTNLELSYDDLNSAKRAKFRLLKQERNRNFQKSVKGIDTFDKDKLNFKKQIPLELPDMRGISKKKLEDYFLVTSLLQNNLQEYSELKTSLNEIVNEVKFLNANSEKIKQEEDFDIEDEDSINDEDNTDTAGDPLSRLLKQRS